MNKFLLSCCLALGIGANAQFTVVENFEAALPSTWAGSGGYTPANYTGIYNDAGCTGTDRAWGALTFTTTTSAKTATLTYTKPAALTSNSKKVDINFDYQINDALTGGSTGALTGNLIVAYSTATTGTAFTTISTTPISAATTGCQHITATIAEGLITGNFRLRITYTSTSANNNNGNYIFVDNVSIIQQATVAPGCTTVTLPASGANPNNNPAITWTTAAGAASYKVYVGTSAGNYNIANGTSVTTLSYSIPGLAANTSYFVKVVPTNSIGDAVGCAEASFTTGALDYCSPKTNADNSLDYVSNVTYEGINNTTAAGANSYSNFTAQKATVKREGTKSLSVTIAADPSFPTDHLGVFIDWNQDKVFAASEYISLAKSVGAGTYSANITVPADALLGDTRMRVLLEYNGSATYVQTACNTSFSYGEIEEYTVTVQERESLAVADTSKNPVSVYPNPFNDVLKISDVKGVKSISVNDISGREVKSLAPSAELNLSSLKTGLYIVNLKMEDGSVKTFKAIKK